MKRFTTILLIAILVIIAGCQATPKKPVVIGKDLDRMINSATKEGVNTDPIAEVKSADRYVKTIKNAKGNCTVNIDAQLFVPDVESIPTYRVSKQEFTQEMADKLVKAFFGDRQLYDPNSFGQMSKKQIQDTIIKLEGELAEGNPNPAEKPDEEAGETGWEELIQMNINELRNMYESAPENPPPLKPFVGEFIKDDNYGGDAYIMHAAPEPKDNRYESLTIENLMAYNVHSAVYLNEEGQFGYRFGEYFPISSLPESEAAAIQDIGISEEEAIGKAEGLLKDAGIDYMTLWSIEKVYGGSSIMDISNNYMTPRRCVYLLEYVRQIDGVPITNANSGGMGAIALGEHEEEASYAEPWNYERMGFAVDDNGIVEFEWTSPYHIEDRITDNTNMISLEDAKNIFEKMFPITSPYAVAVEEDIIIEININKVVLGLMRVTEQNKRDSGLLIPVWDFFGTLIIDGSPYDKDESYMTINAIDGSIVDRYKGY